MSLLDRYKEKDRTLKLDLTLSLNPLDQSCNLRLGNRAKGFYFFENPNEILHGLCTRSENIHLQIINDCGIHQLMRIMANCEAFLRLLEAIRQQGKLVELTVNGPELVFLDCIIRLLRASERLATLTFQGSSLTMRFDSFEDFQRYFQPVAHQVSTCLDHNSSLSKICLKANFSIEIGEWNFLRGLLESASELHELALVADSTQYHSRIPLSARVLCDILTGGQQSTAVRPLIRLRMERCRWNVEDCGILSQGIENARLLQTLDLDLCDLVEQEARLFEGILRAPSLRHLRMRLYSPLSVSAAVALFRVVSLKEELEILELLREPLSFPQTLPVGREPDLAAYAIAKGLAHARSLRSLLLTCHRVEATGYDAFEDVLVRYYTDGLLPFPPSPRRILATMPSVGTELAESLLINGGLVSLDLGTSVMKTPTLQNITESLLTRQQHGVAHLEALDIENLPTETGYSVCETANSLILERSQIALTLATKCHSLTTLERNTYGSGTDANRGRHAVGREDETVRRQIALNQQGIDAYLRFNQSGRERLRRANNGTKEDVLNVIADCRLNADVGCMYDALKIVPNLFAS